MSMTAVTKELDSCNERIQLLQEALNMKDKSNINRSLSQQEHKDNNFGEIKKSTNIAEWHQSEDNRNIKGEDDHKSILNTNCRERRTVIFPIKKHEFSTHKFKEHSHFGVSISEIETVL